MTMRIGHTIFGGAVAGLVIASGIAVCMSNANAKNTVTRHFESSTTALATSTGYGLKQLFYYDQTGNCEATAQGSCVVEYKPLPVEIIATATANGSSKAEFFTYAIANGDALTTDKAVRLIKLYPYHARAFSYAQGDGQSWQLGHAKTAYATAKGFGTTYYVGSSNIEATATISCLPSIEVGVYSDSEAIAEAVATGQFTIGGAGLATAVASVCADSAVTINGTRIFNANSTSNCVASAVAQTIGVHQSQTGNCTANIVATPKFQIGGKGKGFTSAIGVGDAIGIATGVTTVDGNTRAFAVGNPIYNANAYSHCTATAIGTGDSKLTETRVVPKEGIVTATSTGYGDRIKLGRGVAHSNCLLAAAATRIKSVRSIDTLAVSIGVINTVGIGIVPKPAVAVSTLNNKVKRTVSAYSTSVAVATALGYLQVNDLQEAPESRTYILEQSVRLTIVSEEPRTVVV